MALDLFWIVTGIMGWIFITALYFTPTVIAIERRVENKWSVAVINGFLGWTLIGWVVALAMALRTQTEKKPA